MIHTDNSHFFHGHPTIIKSISKQRNMLLFTGNPV